MTAQPVQSAANLAPAASTNLRGLAREANAAFAIAWREVLRAVKSPISIAFTLIFPVILIGLLGGSISDNLGSALPYAYLPFMVIGMIANTLYQSTVSNVMNLIEERDQDFTAELVVAPISRFTVLLGKIIGSAIASMISIVGVLLMIVVMQIPMDIGDLARVLAIAPLLALCGGALGAFLVGFVPDANTARLVTGLAVFPQMFLAGALIPVASSTGVLGFLAKVMPMTYSIDLARNIFYAGKPEYAAAVLHPMWLDLGVTLALFVIFTVIGTYFFVRADRNR
jgi:ABC-2 type transport system permease protein